METKTETEIRDRKQHREYQRRVYHARRFAILTRFCSTFCVSLFSEELALAKQRLALTQVALGELAGVPQNRISQYLRDEHRPERETVSKLAKGLRKKDPKTAMDLMLAYVRDAIPEDWQKRIDVTARE